MNVDILSVGVLDTNCYLIYNDNKKALLVDPGDDENFIIARIKELNLDIVGILITHNHEDHIKCVKTFENIYGLKAYSHSNTQEGKLVIDDFSFDVIYTPGHTSDSVCYYFNEYDSMFVGDFVFKETIGRTDLPTGNYNEIIKSIEKIKKYKDCTILYPGHGDITTLEHEKKYNKYFI